MKDKHNVILILVWSSKFNSLFWSLIKTLGFTCLIFLSGAQCYFNYIIPKIYLIIARIHLVFSTSLSSRYPFITGVLTKFLHDGSSRILFLFEMFIEILFRGAHAFFILHSEVQFSLPYHWRWYYVILDNLSSCFMIHMLLRMRYFKSINLFVGVILCHVCT